MTRGFAMLLGGLAQGALAIGATVALTAVAGTAVAVVVAATFLLGTQGLRRRVEDFLLLRLGDEAARRRAALRIFGSAADGQDMTGPSTQAIRSALDVRFAATEVVLGEGDGDGRIIRLSQSGEPPVQTVMPVVHDGVRVGSILLGPPRRGDLLPPATRSLAREIAASMGASLAAVRLRHIVDAERARAAERRAVERVRLGSELHDRVGPSLAALKMMLAARRRDPSSTQLTGPMLASQADEVAREVRHVLDEIGPVGLDEAGLVAAVETIAVRLAADRGPTVTIESSGRLADLDGTTQAALYAIAVEALNNVVRHAGARRCTVRLEATDRDGVTRLVVEDDGAGIAEDAADGVGSGSMRRRAEELGGGVVVTSVPGGGTRVEATVPVPARDPERAQLAIA